MPKRALSIISAVLATSATAYAAQEREAWLPSPTALRADAAGVSLPQTIGGLSLFKSGELSKAGQGVDNYAQYLSDDGAVQATLYVYMPSYADASLAAYMTDKAVMTRFGSKTRRAAYGSASVAGHTQRAIRAVYDDAAEGALTTASAVLHAGRWLVKLRVTGPTERRDEVVGGLDRMLAGLTFDDVSAVRPIAPANFASCPATEKGDAELTAETGGSHAAPPAPLDGGKLCLRGHVETANGRYDILQQTTVSGGAVLVPIDDAGTVMAFDPAGSGKGYRFLIHSVGQTDLYGVYDKVPSAKQIGQIIDGKDPQTAQAGSVVTFAATGEVTIRNSGSPAN